MLDLDKSSCKGRGRGRRDRRRDDGHGARQGRRLTFATHTIHPSPGPSRAACRRGRVRCRWKKGAEARQRGFEVAAATFGK